MFKYFSTTFVLVTVLGCGDPQVTSVDANNLVNIANAEAEQTKNQNRRQLNSDPDTDLTCLQQCGQDARGTIYSDCLDEGGDHQECGVTGRQWYRECLETKCDESAIQLDNCRTDCRVQTKEAHKKCLDQGIDTEQCREQKIFSVQTCIDECE